MHLIYFLHLFVICSLIPSVLSVKSFGIFDHISSGISLIGHKLNLFSSSHQTHRTHSDPPSSSKIYDAQLESMYQEARKNLQSIREYIHHHFDQISLDWYQDSISHPNNPADFQSWFIQSHHNQLSLNALKDRIQDISMYLNQHGYQDINDHVFELKSNEKLIFDQFGQILQKSKEDLEDLYSQLDKIDQELVEIANKLPLESSLKAYMEQVRHILVYGNMKLKALNDPSSLESEIDIQKYVNFLFQHGKHRKGLDILKDFDRIKKYLLLSWIGERNSDIYDIASKSGVNLQMIEEYVQKIRDLEHALDVPEDQSSRQSVVDFSNLLENNGFKRKATSLLDNFDNLPNCNICLSAMGLKYARLLPCAHIFHDSCIYK